MLILHALHEVGKYKKYILTKANKQVYVLEFLLIIRNYTMYYVPKCV